MAIGAYVTGILATNHDVPALATVPLGGLVAGVVGFLFGFPALRLAGVYLALATFATLFVLPSFFAILTTRKVQSPSLDPHDPLSPHYIQPRSVRS